MALHAVPAGIDPARVRAHLEAVSGVSAVHDLHIWPLSTEETALTCHLVMKDGSPGDIFLAETAHQLKERFGIAHATIQVETGEVVCALEPDHIV
jgi:cobalt-zinc-cadmium efflux system protein